MTNHNSAKIEPFTIEKYRKSAGIITAGYRKEKII